MSKESQVLYRITGILGGLVFCALFLFAIDFLEPLAGEVLLVIGMTAVFVCAFCIFCTVYYVHRYEQSKYCVLIYTLLGVFLYAVLIFRIIYIVANAESPPLVIFVDIICIFVMGYVTVKIMLMKRKLGVYREKHGDKIGDEFSKLMLEFDVLFNELRTSGKHTKMCIKKYNADNSLLRKGKKSIAGLYKALDDKENEIIRIADSIVDMKESKNSRLKEYREKCLQNASKTYAIIKTSKKKLDDWYFELVSDGVNGDDSKFKEFIKDMDTNADGIRKSRELTAESLEEKYTDG